MREIGVRELKSQMSAALRDVEHGTPLTITRHGRPIAELLPPGSASGVGHIHYLVASGKLQPATLPRRPRPKRSKPRNGKSGAQVILEDRDQPR